MRANETGNTMAGIDDIFPKRHESVLYSSCKEFQDEVDRQDRIERERNSIELQFNLTNRLQDLESTLQKQREIDRQERAKEKEIEQIQRQEERRSDRWFAAKTLIIAAILGALLTKFFDFIFR